MLFLTSTSAFITFLAIAAFGFVFLLASAVLGDLFDHMEFGHDADLHGGGPSVLSSRILSVFVTAFGSFGAIGMHLGYGLGASTAMGFGGGLAFAAVIYFFASFLYGQQATSHIQVSDLIGRTGEVSVAIPKGGLGQVRCTLGETVVEKIARSKNNEEIPAHALVRVEAIVGETVLVQRTE